jgi:hypothetical protein
MELVLNRLRSHTRSGEQIQIVEDVLASDEVVLKRLHEEILEPLLRDTRLEREKGLSGDDPLDQLIDMHRNT